MLSAPARERRVAKVAGASLWAAFGERPQPCPDVRPGTVAALAFAVAFGVGVALALSVCLPALQFWL